MAIRKAIKAVFIGLSACFCLTGCTVSMEEGYPIAMKDIITIDEKSTDVTHNDQVITHFLDEESAKAYTEIIADLREKQNYQDIEWQYSQAYIRWYSKYLEAYNLGIINANGLPTGKIEDIRYSLAKYDRNELERLCPTSNNGTKEDFLKWLGSLYFCTTGPDIDTDYPDILFYKFHNEQGKELGYDTIAEIEQAKVTELEEWFRNFLYVEERNLASNPTEIYMTKEQIQERATELLKENYMNPQIDSNIIVLSNGNHAVDRSKLQGLAVDKGDMRITSLVIYGQTIDIIPQPVQNIDLRDIRVDLETNWQDVQENEVKPESYVVLKIGADKVYRLPITNGGKVHITKEQIQSILGS